MNNSAYSCATALIALRYCRLRQERRHEPAATTSRSHSGHRSRPARAPSKSPPATT